MEKINIFRGMFSSRIFMIILVSTVVLQIVIVEFFGTFADTVPLSLELWGISILLGAVSLLVAVILKCIPISTPNYTENVKHHDGYELLPSGPDLA